MIRAALLVLLCLWSLPASAASLEFKEGEKFRAVLAGGAECKVRIARREGDAIIVDPVKEEQGCPTERSILPLGSVTGVKRKRSKASAVWRGIAGGALIAWGGFSALVVAIADGPNAGGRVAAGVVVGGMVAGGILVVRGGHHWSVHVNQEQLEHAP